MKKKITLGVKDRLILRPLMPAEGGRIEMIIVNEINALVEFNTEEIAAFELKDIPGNGVSYNPKSVYDKEFDLTDAQVKILKTLPERLDREKKVSIAMLPLFDKIDAL